MCITEQKALTGKIKRLMLCHLVILKPFLYDCSWVSKYCNFRKPCSYDTIFLQEHHSFFKISQTYDILSTEMIWTSLVAQMVRTLPAMQETLVQPLGWEDPLEKRMAAHSSILTWRIPWTAESMGSQSWTQLSEFHTHTHRKSYSQSFPLRHFYLKQQANFIHCTWKLLGNSLRWELCPNIPTCILYKPVSIPNWKILEFITSHLKYNQGEILKKIHIW